MISISGILSAGRTDVRVGSNLTRAITIGDMSEV
jgi:hypothetical protein